MSPEDRARVINRTRREFPVLTAYGVPADWPALAVIMEGADFETENLERLRTRETEAATRLASFRQALHAGNLDEARALLAKLRDVTTPDDSWAPELPAFNPRYPSPMGLTRDVCIDWVKNNVPLPFGFIMFQEVGFYMASAVVISGDGPLGEVMLAGPDLRLGVDVNRKALIGNFTVRLGAMFGPEAKRTIVIHNAKAVGFAGGGGTTFFKGSDMTSIVQRATGKNVGDLTVLPLRPGENPQGEVIPMLGHWPDAIEMRARSANVREVYSSGFMMQQQLGVDDSVQPLASLASFDESRDNKNFFAFRGYAGFTGIKPDGTLGSAYATMCSPASPLGTEPPYMGWVRDYLGRGLRGTILTGRENPTVARCEGEFSLTTF